MKNIDIVRQYPNQGWRSKINRMSQGLFLLGGVLLCNVVQAYTATASPTSCVNDTSIGTIAWSNPGNALASDNSYATAINVKNNASTNYLKCTGYGFAIPAGSTINGITVYVERKTSGGTIRDVAMRLVKAGVIGTTDLSSTTNYTTADVVEAHGSAGNLWGTSWSVAEINATNFGAAFSAREEVNSGTNRTVSVDQIYIVVDFSSATLPPGTYEVTANPGNCVDDASIGIVAWSNPGNALLSDNIYTTSVVNGTTHFLKCTNYGFAIPTGATINGITVYVERQSSSTSRSTDGAMRVVKGGTIGTTDRSTTTLYTTTDVIEPHGGVADLWGTTWTVADINATNFGAAFAAKTTRSRTISVDHMPIKVSFTIATVLNPGDFNTYDIGTTPAGALDGKIQTKVAGQAFSLDITALNVAKTALLTTYTQTVKVELLNASSGGVLDTNNCNAGWATIKTLTNQTFTGSAAGAGNDVTVTGSAGRHRVTNIVENNAWREVAVRVSYPATGTPTTIGCSTDHFAIRPASFGGLSVSDSDWQSAGTARSLVNTGASGGVMHKAGQPFTVQASAVNAAATPAVTTNYAATPIAVSCVGTATAGVNVCNSAGNLLPVGASACTGTACIGTPDVLTLVAAVSGVLNFAVSYSDVGSFTLQLQDTTFAAVDAADGTPADCTGLYVCSSTLNVGRFVPDHFTVVFDPTNVRLVNRRDIAACEIATTGDIVTGSSVLTVPSASGFAVGDQVLVTGADVGGDDLVSAIASIAGTAVTLTTAASTAVAGAVVQKVGFSYMDEPLDLGFILEAHNTGEGVTQNYTNALAKLNLATPISFGFAAADGTNYFLTTNRLFLNSSSGTWANGAVVVSVTLGLSSLPNSTTPRTGAADGPYSNLYFGINASDVDGVGMLPADYNLDTDATAGFDHVKINSAPAQLRFGRLKLSNASGSELLDLPIPIVTQYWNGTAFVTSTTDNCTTVSSVNMSLAYPVGSTLNTGNMGVSHISLGGSPVGVFAAGRGILKLTKPTGTLTGRGSVTLIEDLLAGNLSYLQGAWTSASYNQNPSAQVTFGVYKGANEFIYQRENY